VTGELHLGHAMFVSMEDLMIRYNRMKGVPTLWVPGTDHAGIATQMLVEKALAKEGLKRDEIGREEFYAAPGSGRKSMATASHIRFAAWVLPATGLVNDLPLMRVFSRAVREAFVTLYEKGLIYRGPRMINWSPALRHGCLRTSKWNNSEEPVFSTTSNTCSLIIPAITFRGHHPP